MNDLDAKLNRWTISRHDFEEAHEYLQAFVSSTDPVIQRALISAAIVAYGRPFTPNFGEPKAVRSITLPEDIFDPDGFRLHEKILQLRNKGIAHSDYTLKPTARVPSAASGLMTWSKPFNPLSEGINIDKFRDMAWQLHMRCFEEASKLNNQLNGAPIPASQGSSPPAGVAINLSIKLSELGGKNAGRNPDSDKSQ